MHNLLLFFTALLPAHTYQQLAQNSTSPLSVSGSPGWYWVSCTSCDLDTHPERAVLIMITARINNIFFIPYSFTQVYIKCNLLASSKPILLTPL